MKFQSILLGFLLFTQLAFSQTPQKFSFQGVARNAAGKLVSNSNVGIRVTIRPETALGDPVYQESQTANTSSGGVFNISVGGGLVQSGDFSKIDWTAFKYFLQLEMDSEGGSNYTNLGATQLLSVPYALHAEEAGRWKNMDPVIQGGIFGGGKDLPPLDNEASTARLIWYPKKAALRFGSSNAEATWSDSNMGAYSFSGGAASIASGYSSFAVGSFVKATGSFAIAMGTNVEAGKNAVGIGRETEALGANSIAIGRGLKSLGSQAVAIGYELESRSRYGAVFGTLNDISDAVTEDIVPTQRIFQIGNGDHSLNTRTNALTVLRNGNVGIGKNVLQATHILDVGNRMRLRSNANGVTAGLWLDNAGGAQYAFIGGYNDDQAGIYFEDGGWRFTVNKNGNAFLGGALTQNSDLRLKRDILPLKFNFEKLSAISGRNYYWKDRQRSQSLQTGLIAQEVEAVFPELVETDKDGYKSVNYIGLIPHLLEAVKELKQENGRLSTENAQLGSKVAEFDELRKRLEAIEASLAKNPGISVKQN